MNEILIPEGSIVGSSDTISLGVIDTTPDGILDGVFDGVFDGTLDGILDGTVDGITDGMPDGIDVGAEVGLKLQIAQCKSAGETSLESQLISLHFPSLLLP